MAATFDRLKILINSSTPMVVMETVEERRALSLVRNACSELQLAMFEWSIADGLPRSGGGAPPPASPSSIQARGEQMGNWGHTSAPSSNDASGAAAKTAVYNSREPVQALANMESMGLEAVFVLKDFHRHMNDPVVVRRLRDVGQKFSTNRRTLILTAPAIDMPPELVSLVEYLELQLPDGVRLRQIIEETFKRLSKTHTLQLKADATAVDAMAGNLRGLTEEEAQKKGLSYGLGRAHHRDMPRGKIMGVTSGLLKLIYEKG